MEPTLIFASAQDWEQWLEAQPADSPGLWLKIAKKGCETPGIDYATALESALCFGWIDGQKRPLDDLFWLQRFTPRKARSRWSRINRDKATALIESGRMRASGLREVERARQDGRWDAAYESQSSSAIPDDLQAALDADPRAAEFFATLDSANRYAVLYRVNEAKRADTRAKRIEKFVAMLHAHETLHPRRPAK
ncbi:MAG TPA: YdeI/OmpD-associated family protein [Actinospica sp.]|nr:YdeI/OmpD-associated family protein [Actinospica sp.]